MDIKEIDDFRGIFFENLIYLLYNCVTKTSFLCTFKSTSSKIRNQRPIVSVLVEEKGSENENIFDAVMKYFQYYNEIQIYDVTLYR